ncbi:hypothetical protein BCR35DRAFT_129610 [Leucosporidium creatinivorum]|uniref:Uncharacterized protein n=1 Tax=Leucosporidium creatinivorum TaxID=106004 RepID=A0A1Y2EUZ3_9BASI|nr:hypothetical protein BCR35DRAFT_129610 [Leucosporidium creatinivorum]
MRQDKVVTSTEAYHYEHAQSGLDYHNPEAPSVVNHLSRRCPRGLQDPSAFELRAPQRRPPPPSIKWQGRVQKPVEMQRRDGEVSVGMPNPPELDVEILRSSEQTVETLSPYKSP